MKLKIENYGLYIFSGVLIIFAIIFFKAIDNLGSSDIYSNLDYKEIKFDKELWFEKEEERYLMSKDLIDSQILIGLTKEKTETLLGPKFYSRSDGTYSYNLGFVPSLGGLDPDFLVIVFKNGIVIKVRQREG